MIKPIDQFKLNIVEVLKLKDTYHFFNGQLRNGIDIDGLLRAQIVFSISALDQYMHQVILYETKNILENDKVYPVSFSKLLVGADVVQSLKNNDLGQNINLIENDLRKKLSWKSYQHPDRISEGLNMVFDIKYWDKLAEIIGISKSEIKQQLKLIVKRRDSIVHEADYDPVNFCQYTINEEISKSSVNFIIEMVFNLDAILFSYSTEKEDYIDYILR